MQRVLYQECTTWRIAVPVKPGRVILSAGLHIEDTKTLCVLNRPVFLVFSWLGNVCDLR